MNGRAVASRRHLSSAFNFGVLLRTENRRLTTKDRRSKTAADQRPTINDENFLWTVSQH